MAPTDSVRDSTTAVQRVHWRLIMQAMSMSMSIVDIAHNREAANALCTLVEREKKSIQVTTKTVNRTSRISKVVC